LRLDRLVIIDELVDISMAGKFEAGSASRQHSVV